MIEATTRHGGPAHPGMGFRQFVAFIAAMMAINALGIDIMLPALPAMSSALGITVENQRQFIIAAYVLGFGAAQLFYGPLSDRVGRKPVLLVSLSLFAVASIAATFSTDFTTIVAARLLQGVVAASSRVLAVSIVRDCYSGRQMARVMSLSFIVFLAVPILAPSIGQLILMAGPWPWIFYFLAAFAIAVVTWGWFKLPETLHEDYRRPISVASILSAAREVVTNRYALGYTLATSLLFGGLMGYINSVQQIFADVFQRPAIFTTVFAATAGTMAIGSFFNSRIVERLGTRLVSHTALLGFIAISGVHLAVAAAGYETVLSFAVLLAATMGCFALAASNFNSMAMEPVGHIAGTASSIQGFLSTTGGALVGLLIGQSFNGTTIPVAAGFFLTGVGSLAMVLLVERGKLFQARNAPVAVPA
ncbi:multidrug effflux MFS transporter [Sphingomonas prati]|uniref:Bcr/CflA family efflux transporter n=1 Tax=Sphingomonas prati TaxID=1843237 RepID=A0A7W9BSG5_9SPHN|nr:multidrug effflux MFS transporter [Sphingomonas prati]MBB5729175.1 DHA1 family bicyclomycin/chloramphenicol resistance-like MFS transporter [Sphingomonas prati]GGE84509.1 Bcr/CflA family drug resistance efflux transporter [Sphingomonas prati]